MSLDLVLPRARAERGSEFVTLRSPTAAVGWRRPSIAMVLAGVPDPAAQVAASAAGSRALADVAGVHMVGGVDIVATERKLRHFELGRRRLASLLFGSAGRELAQRLRGYDATLAMHEDVGVLLAFVMAAQRVDRPLLVVFHGSMLTHPRFPLAMRFLRRRNVWLLGLSEGVHRQLVDEFGANPARCQPVGGATDVTFFRPYPPEREEDGLVASAGVVSRDYAALVEAVAPLEGARLRIATNSAWEPPREIGFALPPNVEAGPLAPSTGLRDLFGRAKVVAVPLVETRVAAGTSSILEGLAMGKPVVTTAIRGRCDLVVDGVNGFVTPPGDVAALRDRIRLLLADPDLARRMGREARRTAEAHASPTALSESLRAVADRAVRP